MNLVSVFVYSAGLATLIFTVSETLNFVKGEAAQATNRAEHLQDYFSFLSPLQEIVGTSDTAAVIGRSGIQVNGNPLPVTNCINLSRTDSGVTTSFSVAVRNPPALRTCPVYRLRRSDLPGSSLSNSDQNYCIVKINGFDHKYQFHPVAGATFSRDCSSDYSAFAETVSSAHADQIETIMRDQTLVADGGKYQGQTALWIQEQALPSLTDGSAIVHYSNQQCENLPVPSSGSEYCDNPPEDWGAEVLTKPYFAVRRSAGIESFFRGTGPQESNAGYQTLDFVASINPQKTGLNSESRTVKLSTGETIPRACRVASPDGEWFTDFGSNKIQHMTVMFTLNKSSEDVLRLEGHEDVKVKHFEDLGVLNLYKRTGKTVSEWLEVAADVVYERTDYTTVTSQSPPRTITFSLGAGIPYTVAGIPSTHYYFAQQWNGNINWGTARSEAHRYCYPAFVSDSENFLSRAKTGSTTSCEAADTSYPRLTGHLPTITTEGEHVFIKDYVAQMVYPFGLPVDASDNRNPFWTDTEYSQGREFRVDESGHSDTQRRLRTVESSNPTIHLAGLKRKNMHNNSGANHWRWVDGFAMGKDQANQNDFAYKQGSNIKPLQGDSAGFFFNSLTKSSSYNNNWSVYFDPRGTQVSGEAPKWWKTRSQSSASRALVIEFGDNLNAMGNCHTSNSCNKEQVLNAGLRLSKEVRVTPSEFFAQCDTE